MRRLIAIGVFASLASVSSLGASAAAREAANAPRCPAGVVDIDPSHPMLAVKAMRDVPPIALALGRDRHDQLKAALARGEDPNVCLSGASVLTVSAVGGDLDEMRILLDGGAQLDSPRDSNGGTPLLAALGLGRYASARLLIERGADVRAAADGGLGALFELATAAPRVNDAAGQLDLATLLLDKGAPVDARAGASGATPLMMAALDGNQSLVQLLLSRGANPALANRRGDTAEAMARRKGHAEVAALLEHAAAPGFAPSAPH